MKSLKITKGQSETVYRRRIDNTKNKNKQTNKTQFGLVSAIIFSEQNPVITELLKTSR